MKNTKLNINSLLQENMTRKEFLRLSGAAILGIVGVTSLVSNLQNLSNSKTIVETKETGKVVAGYGSSAYGK